MRKTEHIRDFVARHNPEVLPSYANRADRNRWAATVVSAFPGKSVLNLGGGGKRHLASQLGSQWSVHEVDVTGDCDTVLNLDTVDRLPFEDGSFDTSCAFDVLEHLENFHLITDEMFRVTKSTMLISLPNAIVEAVYLLRNQTTYDEPAESGVYSKYYGLPLQVPRDRHRWSFSFEDIIRFFVDFESKKQCRVEFYTPIVDPTRSRQLLRWIVGDRIFLNFFCGTVWAKIDKLG